MLASSSRRTQTCALASIAQRAGSPQRSIRHVLQTQPWPSPSSSPRTVSIEGPEAADAWISGYSLLSIDLTVRAISTSRHRTYTAWFSDQSELPALIDGLCPIDDGELTHDVAQVRFDRLLADEELLTDVAVG